jgi:hypothetical protein
MYKGAHQMNIIKLHDECWNKRYLIEFLYGGEYEVDANCEGDAIDIIIDYWEEDQHKHRGYLMSADEIHEHEMDLSIEDFISGGNCSSVTTFGWHEVSIKECTK